MQVQLVFSLEPTSDALPAARVTQTDMKYITSARQQSTPNLSLIASRRDADRTAVRALDAYSSRVDGCMTAMHSTCSAITWFHSPCGCDDCS